MRTLNEIGMREWNEMLMTLNNECAFGVFPKFTKANPNNIEDVNFAMRETFEPHNVDTSDPDNPKAVCRGCDQVVPIKTVAPRKGFYNWHKSSAAGFKAVSDRRSGTPPRTRRT